LARGRVVDVIRRENLAIDVARSSAGAIKISAVVADATCSTLLLLLLLLLILLLLLLLLLLLFGAFI
jgi:hypothetical protein